MNASNVFHGSNLPFGASPLDSFSSTDWTQELIATTQQYLQSFSISADFADKIQLAFGDQSNLEIAHILIDNLANGIVIPNIQIIPQYQLNAYGALGNDTIYISEELNKLDHLQLAVNTFLEETGHFIDSQLNTFDTPGDEGAIFAKLVQNQPLSSDELIKLKTENDHGTLIFNNQTIPVEYADITTDEEIQEISTSEAFSLESDTLEDSNSSSSGQSLVSVADSEPLVESTLDFSEDLLIVSGASGQKVDLQFIWTQREAAFDNEIGVYVVAADGSVNGVAPTDTSYAASVFASSQRSVVFASPPSGQGLGTSRQLTFRGGDRLAFYLIQDNTSNALVAFNPNNIVVDNNGDSKNDLPIAFFSVGAANPDSFDHAVIDMVSEGIFKFAWEDLIGGGDADFNDVQFTVAVTTDAPNPTELPLPGAAMLIPGLPDQSVGVNLTEVIENAGFQSEVGLFLVDDAIGRIGDLEPGDEGYAVAALASERRLMSWREEPTPEASFSVPGNSYIGSYLIQDSTSAEFLAARAGDNPPLAFFSLVAANSDKYDHFRSYPIAENAYELAWEDLTGGGDRDFDDVVLQIAFDVPAQDIPSIFVNDVTVVEGNEGTTDAEVVVSLSNPSSQTVTVDFTTADETATAGEDYEGVNGTVSFAPGETQQLITIPILGDTTDEPNKTVLVNLSNAVNGAIALSSATVTIEDDDDPQPPSISAVLANDTGVSDRDNLTLDPTISGQTTNATTLRASLNGGELVDISDTLTEAGDFTLGLEEYSLLTDTLPDGDYTIAFQAENSGGTESTQVSFTLDRTAPSVPFSLAPESDTGEQGDNTTTEYQVNLVGQTEPGLEVALVNDQQVVTADENGNFVVSNVAMPSVGTAPYTVLARDAAGNQGREENRLTREGLNSAPTITSAPETTLDTTVTDTYTYQVVATDPDNDVLSYSLLDAPFTAEIGDDGLLSFAPGGVLQPSYDFTVEVSDGRGGTDTQTFTVEVPTIVNAQGVIRGTKWEDLNRNGSRDIETFDNFDDIGNLRIAGNASIVESDLVNGESVLRLTTEEEWQAGNALLQTPFDLVDDEGNILSFSTRFQFSISSPTAGLSDEDGFGADGIAFIISPVDNVGEAGGGIGYGGLDNSVAVEIDTYNNVNEGTWDSNNGNHIAINLDGNLTPIEQTNIPTEVDTNRFNNGEIWNVWIDYDGTSQTLEARVSQTNSRPEQPNVSANVNIPEVLETEEFFVGFTSATGLGWGNHDILSWTFGINEPGISGVQVYLDANNNGILDPGEPMQITVEDDPNTPDINETGQYEFTNLLPGTYIVREVVPAGFEQTAPSPTTTDVGNGVADVVLEFVSGGNAPSPLVEPYGSTGGIPPTSPFNNNGQYTVEPVEPTVVLGPPPPSPVVSSNPEVDWLALPEGSYVTVGFTDERVIDGPGDDIFIRSFGLEDSANELADVYVSANGVDFEFLGTVNEMGLVSLDLATIGFTEPVTAVRVVGLDNRGSSPGFDLIGVEVLPDSIQSAGFHNVELGEGEVVENINFGNAEIPVSTGIIRGTKWEDINGDGIRNIDRVELVNNSTQAYYNDNLGNLYPGDPEDPLAQFFFAPNGTDTQNFFDGQYTEAPDLSEISQLENWLVAPEQALQNVFWSELQTIPLSWNINDENAIIYEVDGGTTGISDVVGSFGVDNGLFIWVNGEYKFGANGPGVVEPGEYQVNLGDLNPGRNYIQVLRQDYGGVDGYDVQITGIRNFEPGLAGVSVYLDTNNNAILDPGEPVQVTAEDDPSTPDIDETGQYEFTDLPAGTYTVREVVPEGFEQTFPQGGQQEVTINFDNLSSGTQPSNALQDVGVLLYSVEASGTVAVSENITFENVENSFQLLDYSQFSSPPNGVISLLEPLGDVLIEFTNPVNEVSLVSDLTIGDPGGVDIVRLIALEKVGENEFEVLAIDEIFDDETTLPEATLSLNLGNESFSYALFEVTTELEGFDDLSFIRTLPNYHVVELGIGEIVENRDFGNIQVGTGNLSPRIISTPFTRAVPGVSYGYEVRATDGDGDPLLYSLLTAPEGMTIDENGVIAWETGAIGTYSVEIQVDDGQGGVVTQSYEINVVEAGAGSQVPQVNLGFSSSVLDLGDTLNLQIQGFDDVGLADLDLAFGGNSLLLNPDSVGNGLINTASVTPDAPGLYKVVATAVDTDGNVVTKTQDIRVVDPSDTEAPFVEINLTEFEANGSVIRSLTDLVGTVTDENLEFYRVEIAPVSLLDLNNFGQPDPDYILIAEGNSNVTNSTLAQIDPLQFNNDSYFIRVYAQDFSGNGNVQGIVLGIDTATKPGEFSIDFVDLSLPLTGIPIEITRSYSSLDANIPGDFGYGWTLGLQEGNIVESSPTGIDLSQDDFFGGNSFTVGTRVTLNTPDGRRVGFTFDPVPQGSLLGTAWKPRFTPDPGVFDTLEVEDSSLSLRSDGTYGLFLFGFSYNPSEYKLTTRDRTVYNYSQNEGLQNVIDRNGNSLIFSEEGIISSTGAEIDFIRDGAGRIIEIIDPEGNSLKYGYNANGDLVSVTDRQENTTTLKYEAPRPHYLTEIIDPLGRSGTRTEYGENGQISRIIDADGNAIELNFDNAASSQTLTDPFGNELTLIYDERGNVLQQIDPLGGVTTRTYDEDNNILTETDPEENTTTFTYDENGNVLTQTDPLGNTTTFVYNEFSQVLTETNPLGFVTTNEYDDDGNLIQTTDAEGNVTTYVYDEVGNLQQATDEAGNVTAFAYNLFGLITQITDPEEGVTALNYDNNGNITSVTTPRGFTTTFGYNNENLLTTLTDALGNVNTIEYDAAGQRTATVDALGRRTEFTYNNRGLLETTTYPDGTVETLVYDALDRQIATIDRNGNRTEFQYDPLNRLIGVVDALNNQTTYERDLNGNLIRQTDANGRNTRFTYDELNRIATTTLPLGQTSTNTYDALGNLVQVNDFNGNVLNYDYDGLQQLTEVSLADGTALETFTYTPTGLVATTEDERGLTQFTYDGLDQLTSRIDPDGAEIVYLYDADGNVAALTTPAGTVSYNYDGVGNLDTVTDREGLVTDYDYDAVGNLIQTTFPNGVIETHQYDVLDRIQQLTTTDNSNNILTSYTYTFDNVGNRLSETDNTGRVTNYTYDDLYRVTEVEVTDSTLGDETTTYTYNAVGNIQTKIDSSGTTTYTYDENDRLLQEESNGQVITYTYDEAGNRIDKRVNGIIVEVYNWNIQGELAGATITEGETTTNVVYQYNTNGIRVSQTVDGDETRFLIDTTQQEFAQVIEEYSPGGIIQVVYTHGNDLISQTRDTEKGFYHADSLGSVRLLTDIAGNVANAYLYDPYGSVINQLEVQENAYKFTGEQFDSELENYYLRARYYNPATGRFVSRDPFAGFLERPLSLNDYLYGEGNPINAIDPSGEVALIEYVAPLVGLLGDTPGFVADFADTLRNCFTDPTKPTDRDYAIAAFSVFSTAALAYLTSAPFLLVSVISLPIFAIFAKVYCSIVIPNLQLK
ncbi:DUF4114 domain-containing protein [Cronbergia sp. UHCC 0137]|uniref:lectin-like domain-containing protein n=1 Tax=Cronbergia sp. UHCC 0137 TaxID=3110239 RepID=UPI002B219395|nr:DUF4114 domain-containing protein [Cronbergia sp. UHCC 0137]MEA5620583.1 DUF4114 domain-containing protein [Cronbergia sp. UHCC 0137]